MIEIYNPYGYNYKGTIVQDFSFYDPLSKFVHYSGSLTPEQYFTTISGMKKFSFSLSTLQEMDTRPLKNNCVIDLSPAESDSMSQVEIDYYYEQEKRRCFDHFVYSQNATFQLLSFKYTVYPKLLSLFGPTYNFLIPLGETYLDLATFDYYNPDLPSSLNIFFDVFHRREISVYHESIQDIYSLSLSRLFIPILGIYQMSRDNFDLFTKEIYDNYEKYNHYPNAITYDQKTGRKIYTPTPLSLFRFDFCSHAFKTERYLSYVKQHFTKSGDTWIPDKLEEGYIDGKFDIAPWEGSYSSSRFYSIDGTIAFFIEIVDFSVLTNFIRKDTSPYTPEYSFYFSPYISEVFFRIRYFSIRPDLLPNNSDLSSLSTLLSPDTKPKFECCLAECFGITE